MPLVPGLSGPHNFTESGSIGKLELPALSLPSGVMV